MKTLTLPIALMAATLIAAGPAAAGTDLFGADTVVAWAGVTTAAAASGEASWMSGGFGKLRFGSGSPAVVTDAGIDWQPRLTDTLQFHAVGQYDSDALSPFAVTESYFSWKPVPTSAVRYAFRVGRLLPPISLENDDLGWSASRTLTPSAIDSWVGEELLVTGAEASVRTTVAENGLGATMGLFQGADAAGSILAYRGWALQNLVTGGNAALRLPQTPGAGYAAVFTKQAGVTRPGVEVDGRAGYYVRGDWRPPLPVSLNLLYFYNPANPTIVTRGQYGWTTKFYNGGLVYGLRPDTEVLAQAMWGATKMGAVMPDGRHPADMIFQSAYVLISHRFEDASRLSLRGDYFATRDNSFAHLYDNNEHGYSATAAWIRPWTPHLRSALEIVDVASRRGARATVGEPEDQSQTMVELSIRVRS